MPILAIDTATMVSSVAVADAGKLLAELTVQTRLTHSETLLPHVQQVLEMANTTTTAISSARILLFFGFLSSGLLSPLPLEGSFRLGSIQTFLLVRIC